VLLLRTLTENTLHQPLLDAERYQLAQKGFLVGLALTYVAEMLKAAVFLVFALFEIARVNDKADELYAELSNSVWRDVDKDNERMKC
jgi:hypothetical protein